MSLKAAPKRKAAPEGMDWSGNQSDDSNEHRFHGRMNSTSRSKNGFSVTELAPARPFLPG
ncbi:hypothetical protein [Burkholderia ubonensis]|uniref:hypothetical protein n=1 Tax=Burkholderia ubonensis TaxID=101571 RepID=UPI0012FB546D|nr:hypothetical protein [Burkholderia ubonensis]